MMPMAEDSPPVQSPDAPPDSPPDAGLWTVPNVMCFARLVATPGLFALAWFGHNGWFLAMFCLFLFMDWLDGKLARYLNQFSTFGARLDSFADAIMYLALPICVYWLEPEMVKNERLLIIGVAITFAATVLAGVVKFGKPPSYHTKAAKLGWLLITIGIVCALLHVTIWPLRAALVVVILANLEAIAITCVLRRPAFDLPSVWHAWKLRENGDDAGE